MTAIEYLDQQVRQVCPRATGVSIGKWAEKATWRANGPLSDAEKAAAQTIFDAFDKTTYEASQVPTKTKAEWLADMDAATTVAQLRAAVKGALSA